MMRNYLGLMLLAAAVSFMGARPAAADLEQHVPGGYDLTVNVDMRTLMDEPRFEAIRKALLGPGPRGVVQFIKDLSGIDLLTDLDRVLIAGYLDDARRENGLVVLEGQWTMDDVLSIFEMNEYYDEIPFGSDTIFGFWSEDDAEMRYLGFIGETVVALGRRDAIESLLQVKQGKAEAMTANPAYKARLEASEPGALVRGVVLARGAKPEDEVGRQLLQTLEALSLTAHLREGMEFAAMLTTVAPEAGRAWAQMAEGGVAFGKMMGHEPVVQELARRVQVANEGPTVAARMTLSMEELRQLLAMHPKLRKLRR